MILSDCKNQVFSPFFDKNMLSLSLNASYSKRSVFSTMFCLCFFKVVGTPCYISPELCESKPYNQKSDIWALGCVLYELCTLSRAFEAANLPALVFKIMKGSYKQISDTYSPELKQLVRSLLNLDHTKRPSVSQILAQPIIVKVMYCTIVGIGAITMNTASSRNQVSCWL